MWRSTNAFTLCAKKLHQLKPQAVVLLHAQVSKPVWVGTVGLCCQMEEYLYYYDTSSQPLFSSASLPFTSMNVWTELAVFIWCPGKHCPCIVKCALFGDDHRRKPWAHWVWFAAWWGIHDQWCSNGLAEQHGAQGQHHGMVHRDLGSCEPTQRALT